MMPNNLPNNLTVKYMFCEFTYINNYSSNRKRGANDSSDGSDSEFSKGKGKGKAGSKGNATGTGKSSGINSSGKGNGKGDTIIIGSSSRSASDRAGGPPTASHDELYVPGYVPGSRGVPSTPLPRFGPSTPTGPPPGMPGIPSVTPHTPSSPSAEATPALPPSSSSTTAMVPPTSVIFVGAVTRP